MTKKIIITSNVWFVLLESFRNDAVAGDDDDDDDDDDRLDELIGWKNAEEADGIIVNVLRC
jgi:hypothetical protein